MPQSIGSKRHTYNYRTRIADQEEFRRLSYITAEIITIQTLKIMMQLVHSLFHKKLNLQKNY